MIPFYLREAEIAGCEITASGKKLMLHDSSVLKKEQIETLTSHKHAILVNLRQREEATHKGWMVYSFGEAYEKQVSANSLVFLFRERDGTFTVWRGTWKGDSLPESEKVLISHVDFDEAFLRANNYVNWYKTNIGKGGR